MSVFLDSSYLIAITNERDIYHEHALRISDVIKVREFGEIFISTYVFDETVTYILGKQGHSKAVETGKLLLDSGISVLNVNEDLFNEAWELFKERKNISFTDCTIVKLMRENNIKNLASFDKEFLQFNEINVLI